MTWGGRAHLAHKILPTKSYPYSPLSYAYLGSYYLARYSKLTLGYWGPSPAVASTDGPGP